MNLTDEMIARGCAIYLQEHPEFREHLDQLIQAAGLPRPEPDEVTPSFHGVACLANGKHAGIECQCDECDDFLDCFPDWQDLI